MFGKWIVFCFVAISSFAMGWAGYVHHAMAEVAIERLPQAQQEMLKPYRQELISTYTLIPDLERTDDSYRRFIDTFLAAYDVSEVPESKERLLLHAADKSETNAKTYEYYTHTVFGKFKTGDTEEAVKYLGTFLHFIQDTSCPAHMRYGPFQHPRGERERMPHFSTIHFFKRFMPVPEQYEDAALHGIIDRAGFTVEQLRERVGEYEPAMLGTTLAELLDAFQVRHEAMMATTDKILIPILQARFDDDDERFAELGLDAAELSVKLAADYLYTLLSLIRQTDLTVTVPPDDIVPIPGRAQHAD